MSELILGITLLIFLLFWKYVWQKTLLDTTRDHLFDLRDELRSCFLSNGYGLEHPIYHELRAIINSYLFHTEKATMSSFIVFTYVSEKFPDYNKKRINKFEDRFKVDDQKLKDIIKYVRIEAWAFIVSQMIFRSIFLTFVFCIFSVVICIYKVIVIIKERFPSMSMPDFRQIVTTIFIGLITYLPIIKSNPSMMEKYSNASNLTDSIFIHCH